VHPPDGAGDDDADRDGDRDTDADADGEVDLDGDAEGEPEADGEVGVPPMPVTSPLPPSKTMSEQLKKFSWLSERTHWMNSMCRPDLPDGSVVLNE